MTHENAVRKTIDDIGWSRRDTPAVCALEDCIRELKDKITLPVLNAAASASGYVKHRYHRPIEAGQAAPFAGFTFRCRGGTMAVDIPHFADKTSGTLMRDLAAYTMGDISDEHMAHVIDAFIGEIRRCVTQAQLASTLAVPTEL